MLRRLAHDDVPAAFRMSGAAGWNQTVEDWLRLLALEPEGCFGIESDGQLVATNTLLCYGQDLAWLGMVLTHPQYRRRGYAQRLLGAALDLAEGRGIRSVKLDATELGRCLYLKFGFEDEQPIERWMREPGPLNAVGSALAIGVPDARLDCAAFGIDRLRFLAMLGEAACLDDAFVMQRSGSLARYLGPCVARTASSAEYAIRATIASHAEETWFWDLLPKQAQAVRIAHSLGFKPVRHLMRMRRGVPVSGEDGLVYATGGFEAG
jgi:GNAT superfamily N-acetyltransferase